MATFEAFKGDTEGLRCAKCLFSLKSKKKYKRMLATLRKKIKDHLHVYGNNFNVAIKEEKNEIHVNLQCFACNTMLNLGWA